MGKRKKSYRNFFDRRRNYVRKRQALRAKVTPSMHCNENSRPNQVPTCLSNTTNVEAQQPDASLLHRHHPNAAFTSSGEQVSAMCDPIWHIIVSEQTIKLFTIQQTMSEAEPSIGRTVIVNDDLSWHVCVCGRQLTRSTPTLSDLPVLQLITSFDHLTTLLQHILSLSLCPGNSDSDLVELIVKEGGEFKANGKVLGSLDTSSEFTIDGQMFNKTIRASDCYMLCNPSSSDRTARCAACTRYRSQLRVKRSHEKFHDESTSVAHDSHTKYTHLQRDELVERLRNCQKEKRSLKSKCSYRSAQIKIIRTEGVKMSEGDSDDLSKLIEELSPQVENEFDKDSPQDILWREQAKYNSLKTK